jgi:hypothetical protein
VARIEKRPRIVGVTPFFPQFVIIVTESILIWVTLVLLNFLVDSFSANGHESWL